MHYTFRCLKPVNGVVTNTKLYIVRVIDPKIFMRQIESSHMLHVISILTIHMTGQVYNQIYENFLYSPYIITK